VIAYNERPFVVRRAVPLFLLFALRQDQRDFRPFAGDGLNAKLSADSSRAFLHTEQPYAFRSAVPGKSFAPVLDRYLDVSSAIANRNRSFLHVRVFAQIH